MAREPVYKETARVNRTIIRVEAYDLEYPLPSLIHIYESEPDDEEGLFDAVRDDWLVGRFDNLFRKAIFTFDEQIKSCNERLWASIETK